MSRKRGNWVDRQRKDPYVKRATTEGYRSRAVYKLIEIDERDRLIKRGMRILDLGAAPGGWSQYAARKLAGSGQIVAVDLLPIEPIEGVQCIRGDFTDEIVLESVLDALGGPVDLVMSDMAPNLSGLRSVDQPRAMYLADLAAEVAERVLSPQGALLVKLFHGAGMDDYVKSMRLKYCNVRVRKPKASRPKSRETYLLARASDL